MLLETWVAVWGLFSSLALVVAAVFRFHGPFPVFLCLPCLLFVS